MTLTSTYLPCTLPLVLMLLLHPSTRLLNPLSLLLASLLFVDQALSRMVLATHGMTTDVGLHGRIGRKQ